MSIERVVIIIPTYNEAQVIEGTLTQVFHELAKIKQFDLHVLVFDSASTDATRTIISSLQTRYANLHLQTEPSKTGLGSAYHQAMRYALDHMQADIVFEFDADLSHQPQYIAPMLEKLKQHDVVVGSRYVRGGSIPSDWGWHRKCLSQLGNYIARALLTPKYKDFTSGFRATRRTLLIQALPQKFLSSQYAYKLQLFWNLHQCRARIAEYPIAFVDRKQGQSKLPTNSILDAISVLLTLRFRVLKRFMMMCLVGVSGALIQFLLYNLLRYYFSPMLSAQLAVAVAIINNFLLNNRFTFNNIRSRKQRFSAFAIFSGYSAGMIAVQGYWLHLGVAYFGSGAFKENMIMLAGIALGSILNYMTYSQLVWRDGTLKKPRLFLG